MLHKTSTKNARTNVKIMARNFPYPASVASLPRSTRATSFYREIHFTERYIVVSILQIYIENRKER